MRNKTAKQRSSPFGKVHDFKERNARNWSPEQIQTVGIPAIIPIHKVIPIQYVPGDPTWVRVCTITSKIDPSTDAKHFLPICRNVRGMARLHLVNTFNAWTVLAKESYLRIDSMFDVPLEMLVAATRADGLPLELKQHSFDIVKRQVSFAHLV